ncbi:hypothetical protein EV361DRAFT_978684, partial [Lentinula raphanica]
WPLDRSTSGSKIIREESSYLFTSSPLLSSTLSTLSPTPSFTFSFSSSLVPSLVLLFSAQAWAQYFHPVMEAIYWRSLTYLVAVNFPFVLAAWVYLFVFMVTGTMLLILLPLGAILCFFNLLSARAFSRAEV